MKNPFRKGILFFLLFITASPLPAGPKIDSLLELLPRTSDSERVSVLIQISHYYQSRETEKSLDYCKQAIALAEKLGNKQLIADAYYRLGNVYNGNGNYTRAFEALMKSYALFDEVKYYKGMANSANSIGNIYLARKDTANMFRYYRMALASAEKSGSEGTTGAILVGLGNAYSAQGKYAESIEYFQRAAGIFKKAGKEMEYVVCMVNTGSALLSGGDALKAEDIFQSVLPLAEKVGNKYVMALTYAQCGLAKDALGRPSDALLFHYKALQAAREINARDNVSEISRYLSDSYFAMGRADSAYKYLKLFADLRDSIFNEETAAQTAEMQARFDAAEKDKALLEKDSELKQQAMRLNMFLIAFALVLALAMIVYRSYYQKKKTAAEISRQKSIIEEKNKDITDSIRYAQHLQTAILPPDDLVYEHLKDCFILYKPKDIVSGDFYWMFPQGPNVYFASVDCTGHGVPGAFMSIVGHNTLNFILNSRLYLTPSEILDTLNTEVRFLFSNKYSHNLVNDGMDISVCLLNRKEMKLQFAGANNPLYLIRNKELIEIRADKQAIGGMYDVDPKPFTNHEIALQKDDCIYIFSDGYADQFGGPDGKKFKYSRMKEQLLSVVSQPMFRQKQHMNGIIEKWKGGLEQVDDMLLMGVRI
ncbi:MAG: tetratricopeptide repeat protein [Bacteroidota bacterium]